MCIIFKITQYTYIKGNSKTHTVGNRSTTNNKNQYISIMLAFSEGQTQVWLTQLFF